MAQFKLPVKILLQHCDTAGIVFYPRFFEMANLVVERWFEDELGYSFADMILHDGLGVPTAAITAQFKVPSRLGDDLQFRLSVTRLGRTSVSLRIAGFCEGVERLSFESTLVHVSHKDGRPRPWSEAVRSQIGRFVSEASAA